MNFRNTLANDATDGICSGHNQMQQIRWYQGRVLRKTGSAMMWFRRSHLHLFYLLLWRSKILQDGFWKERVNWWSEVSMFMILKCDFGVWRGEGGLPLIPSSRHGLDGLWQWGHKELWFLGGEFARSARGNAPERLCGSVCIDLFPWSFSYFLQTVK